MDYLSYANSPALWVFAAAIFIVVVFQAIIFARFSRDVAAEEGLSRSDIKVAMRVGAFSAIGPSVAVAIVAIGLIPVFGTPAALMRIGMVGSVQYELVAASVASSAMGVELGGKGFDGTAFAAVFFTMALGAGIWMLIVLVGTKTMGTLHTRVQAWNPWVMNVVPGAALIGAFAYLTVGEATGGITNLLVMLGSGLAMVVLLAAAHRYKNAKMQEWALSLSMLAGLIIAIFAQ